MELYLCWLDKHEQEPEEASPLGIILRTGKKSEQIELQCDPGIFQQHQCVMNK
jgi:hypothetical protein